VAIWYIFPRFGILWQEKSGNPGCYSSILNAGFSGAQDELAQNFSGNIEQQEQVRKGFWVVCAKQPKIAHQGLKSKQKSKRG
jgi:hypothetical protein